MMVTICQTWNLFSEDFRSDVWLASGAYQEGFEAASDSISRHRAELYTSLAGELLAGCRIDAVGDSCVTTLYSLTIERCETETRPDGREGIGVWWSGVILTLRDRDVISFAVSALDEEDPTEMYADAVPVMEKFFVDTNGSVDSGLLFSVVDQLVFRRYANVEKRSADEKPKTVVEKPRPGQDHLVKVPFLEVSRYDVNWYTETVRSAGFARKGYMAVRWKGPRSERRPEIVPVRPTWVKGYTRRARKPDAGIELRDLDSPMEN